METGNQATNIFFSSPPYRDLLSLMLTCRTLHNLVRDYLRHFIRVGARKETLQNFLHKSPLLLPVRSKSNYCLFLSKFFFARKKLIYHLGLGKKLNRMKFYVQKKYISLHSCKKVQILCTSGTILKSVFFIYLPSNNIP